MRVPDPLSPKIRLFRVKNPAAPPDTPQDLTELLAGFAGSATADRLRNATELRREQQFAFPFGDLLVTGVFDVVAREAGDRSRRKWRISTDFQTRRRHTGASVIKT